MIKIIFIRHGATKGNLEKRYIGRTDEPLCNEGIEQILMLKNENIYADNVFTSPMTRTMQTAKILFPTSKIDIIDDFVETDFGIFEGKTANELSENKEYKNWINSMCIAQIPEGESIENFKYRCCNAFKKIMSKIDDDSTIAFVIHGGVIMSILEEFATPKKGFYDYHISNGEYILGYIEEKNIINIMEKKYEKR